MESNKIKKVLFFFDSRATFSFSSNIIKIFNKKKINYQTIVSGNFLEKKFKIQKDIFEKYKIKVLKKIKFNSPNQKPSSWTTSMGRSIIKYSHALDNIKPDLIVLTGDRIETLAMCITASYMNIRIAHIQAGDESGHIDDLSRAAISKFSHLHFASSIAACKRLESWGEKKNRIFFTGAPQLEDISTNKSYNDASNYFVVIFHPVLNENDKLKKQILNLLNSIKYFSKYKFYWIFPNNDFGHNIILKELKNSKLKNLKLIANLPRDEFICTLSNSRGIIGNSSCGIIEASRFPIPSINIGSRQNGRPQSKNIINVSCEKKEIINAVKKVLNKNYLNRLIKNIKNPYYKKNSNHHIYKLLFKYKKNSNIFKKY